VKPARSLLIALCLGAAAAACGDAPRRPNVLLIVVDTLRADHLSTFGYRHPTSPALDRFAERAARFPHASTPRAKTTPAIASLMTGLYPHEHGVRDLLRPIDATLPLVSESFARAGYRTGAIVGNYVLQDAHSGLARGFETWVEDLPDQGGVPPHAVPERRAGSLTDGALVALGLAPAAEPGAAGPRGPLGAPGESFFLYLHYMDPHGAYDPPADLRVFEPGPVELIPAEADLPPHAFQRLRVAEYNVPAEAISAAGTVDAARVRALYDAEVHSVDRELGRLFEALERAGLLEDTLVVVTADHGESLGEHRYYFEHGLYAYETTNRVPLLVRGPGIAPGTHTADVSLVDLAPTLLELCDLAALAPPAGAPAEGPRGRSFAALLTRGTGLGERAVFSEKVERADLAGSVQIKAVRLGRWKLLWRLARREVAAEAVPELLSEELYDLERDPGETENRIGSPPAEAPLELLRAELERFTAADKGLLRLPEELQREREQLEREHPERAEMLRRLGY
jgi:arylsulfatase A-like enzyme